MRICSHGLACLPEDGEFIINICTKILVPVLQYYKKKSLTYQPTRSSSGKL
uniref:Uncharacterized protein n=1 Tax=Arion vulgaris TaxID=1028688 RepID=A0A0B7A4E7_9EUPU